MAGIWQGGEDYPFVQVLKKIKKKGKIPFMNDKSTVHKNWLEEGMEVNVANKLSQRRN